MKPLDAKISPFPPNEKTTRPTPPPKINSSTRNPPTPLPSHSHSPSLILPPQSETTDPKKKTRKNRNFQTAKTHEIKRRRKNRKTISPARKISFLSFYYSLLRKVWKTTPDHRKKPPSPGNLPSSQRKISSFKGDLTHIVTRCLLSVLLYFGIEENWGWVHANARESSLNHEMIFFTKMLQSIDNAMFFAHQKAHFILNDQRILQQCLTVFHRFLHLLIVIASWPWVAYVSWINKSNPLTSTARENMWAY